MEANLAVPLPLPHVPGLVGALVVLPELLHNRLDPLGDGAGRPSSVLQLHAALSGLHEHVLVPSGAVALLPRLTADVAELLAANARPDNDGWSASALFVDRYGNAHVEASKRELDDAVASRACLIVVVVSQRGDHLGVGALAASAEQPMPRRLARLAGLLVARVTLDGDLGVGGGSEECAARRVGAVKAVLGAVFDALAAELLSLGDGEVALDKAGRNLDTVAAGWEEGLVASGEEEELFELRLTVGVVVSAGNVDGVALPDAVAADGALYLKSGL